MNLELERTKEIAGLEFPQSVFCGSLVLGEILWGTEREQEGDREEREKRERFGAIYFVEAGCHIFSLESHNTLSPIKDCEVLQ